MFWRGCLAKVALVSLACLVVVVAVLASRTTAEGQSIGDGSFIRQAGTESGRDVYRVNIVNGKRYKWLILNEAAFCSYGCPWNQVHDVSWSVINRYQTSNLARRGSDSKVWRFTANGDTGTRQWLNMTPAEFEAAGFDWDAVHSINTTDFNQYRQGPDLTCLDYPGSCRRTPVVNLAHSSLTYDEGAQVSAQRIATVTDQDTPLRNLTVTVSGLPSGLRHSFSTSSGRVTISGTPASGTAGTYRVTVWASDGRLSDDDTFRVRVRPGASPPVINIRSNQSFETGQRLSSVRVATVSDQDTPLRNLDVTVRGLPRNLSYSLNRSSGQVTISGTVSSNAPRRSRVTITANDGTTTATESFTIYVAPPNRPPEISGTSDHAWQEGHRVSSLQVATVTDPDNTLRSRDIMLSGLPSGLTKGSYRASDGRLTITGTVGSGVAGTYTVTVQATDGVTAPVQRTFVIRVLGRQSEITNGSFIRQSGTNDVYRVKIINGEWYKWLILNETAFCSYGCPWNQVHDVSRSVMNRYQTSNLARHGSDSKVWRFTASGDSGTRQWLNMTPAEFEAAGFDRDAVHSLPTIEFNEYVEGTVLTCSDFNVCAAPPSGCQISEATSSLSLRERQRVSSQRVAAVTAPCRSASVSGLPSGLSGSFSSSNRQVTISGAPAAGSAGSYTATISASDGTRTTHGTFQITVTRSDNPPPIVTIRGNFTFERGEDIGALQVATVTDNEPLVSRNVQLSGLPSGLRKADYNPQSGQLQIAGTVSPNAREQAYTVTISASDGVSTTRETLQITIGAGDCGSLGALTAGEIERVRGEWTSGDPEDHPDGEPRYFDRCRFELTSPATVAIELSSDAVESSLTVAPTASPRHILTNQHGSPGSPARASLTLSAGGYYIYAATLWEGDTGGYVLRATIADLPEFASDVGEITWQRGVEGTRQLPAASGGLPPYAYSLRTPSGDSTPEGMTFNPDTRTLTGAPLGEVGRHRLTYRVTDAMGFEAEQTFHLKYEEVACTDDRHAREEPLAPGETWTSEGEWTSTDCVTKRTEFIKDHIGHYRDIYSFQVSEAVEVMIDLESDGVGTYIHLLDNSGQRVTLTGTGGSGNNARITADLETGETYWIRATAATLGATGSYALTVSATVIDGALAIARAYAPIMTFDSRERYFPVPIAAMLDHSDLRMRDGGVIWGWDTRIRPRTTTLTSNPDKTLLGILAGTSDEQHLDFDRDAWDSASQSDDYRQKYPSTIYARLHRINGNLVLQYWFFYVYNPGPVRQVLKVSSGEWRFDDSLELQSHEGDWEGIQIVFARGVDEKDVLAGVKTGMYVTPLYVEYATHEGGERHCWDDADVEKIQSVRVKVYPALGSHATYPTAHPDGVAVSPIVKQAAWDKNDGSGRTLNQYHIEMVDELTDWIFWYGRWGEDNRRDDLGGGNNWSGPKGPRTKTRWSNLSWTGDDSGCNRYGVIAVKGTADGDVEVGYRPTGSDLILPQSRFLRTTARLENWYQSGPVKLGGITLGRVSVRWLAGGRVEIGFKTSADKRILPERRIITRTQLERTDIWWGDSEVNLAE